MKTDLSGLTVNTDGMELYDRGEEKAYLALFEKFSDKNEESEDMNDKDSFYIGIIGMTPQDVSDLKAANKIRKVYADQGMRDICYGMGDGLHEVRNASLAAKNVVVSPAALKAAQYLQKKFGTPYEIAYPLASELLPEVNYQGKKILIVQGSGFNWHQPDHFRVVYLPNIRQLETASQKLREFLSTYRQGK